MKLSKIYAGAAMLTGAGLGASVVYAPLRPFSTVFKLTALGLVGAAAAQKNKEQEDFKQLVKALVKNNSASVFGSDLPQKSVDELSDQDMVQLALLLDSDIEELSPPLQAEALKAQILLEMVRAEEKGIPMPAQPDFAIRSAREKHSPSELARLREEREELKELMKSDGENKNGDIKDVLVLGGTEAAEVAARKAVQKYGLSKAFSVSEITNVLKSSGQILLEKGDPFETLEELIDFELERYQTAVEKFGQPPLPPADNITPPQPNQP